MPTATVFEKQQQPRVHFTFWTVSSILVPRWWPSVLWRCWLGGRNSIRPVKNWVVGCWRGYLSGARCRLPLTVSWFSKIQIGFTFLVLAHPGSPGKRAVKRVCVCVCACACVCVCVCGRARVCDCPGLKYGCIDLMQERLQWLCAFRNFIYFLPFFQNCGISAGLLLLEDKRINRSRRNFACMCRTRVCSCLPNAAMIG